MRRAEGGGPFVTQAPSRQLGPFGSSTNAQRLGLEVFKAPSQSLAALLCLLRAPVFRTTLRGIKPAHIVRMRHPGGFAHAAETSMQLMNDLLIRLQVAGRLYWVAGFTGFGFPVWCLVSLRLVFFVRFGILVLSHPCLEDVKILLKLQAHLDLRFSHIPTLNSIQRTERLGEPHIKG
mmetsp:Transcript_13513/g.31091  ORF Transcript_13513/g.31091 Transcript_13513/m.31091 type:complete len:177 (+) Transcript_13513:266-796(+)